MRRTRPGAPTFTATCLVIGALIVGAGGSAQLGAQQGGPTTSEPSLEQQREDVQRRQQETSGRLDVLKASEAEVRKALDEVGASVVAQRAETEAARAAAEAADAASKAASDAYRDAVAKLEQIDEEVRQMAVEAFVNPPEASVMELVESGSPAAVRHGSEMLATRAEYRSGLLTRQRAATAAAKTARADAKEAAAAASRLRVTADSELEALEQRHAEQVRLAAEVDARLELALAEAGSLSALDAQLAQEIETREVALAAEAARYDIDLDAIEQQARAASGQGGTVTWADVVKVQGIWVHTSIADQVDQMLTAANVAGIHLSGGGYRDSAQQVALRAAHCGTSDYAIYQMPASQCSPPTARPGQSMHERGLAMDLQCDGALITSRSSKCFAWLSQHAADYGFYNLPSEPWHWSTTGR